MPSLPRRSLLPLVLGLILAGLPRPAAATWSHDANVNNLVCNAANNQFWATTIPDGSGGAIVTWEDYRAGSANANIFAQHLAADGTPQWGNASTGLVICNAASVQAQPAICTDGAGGAIILWADERSGTGNADLYAQHISSAGAIQWGANGALMESQVFPDGYVGFSIYSLCSDGAGGAWLGYGTQPGNLGFLQHINGGGSLLLGTNGVVLGSGYTLYPSQFALTPDGAGGLLVAYCASANATGNPRSIYAQRVNAAGGLLWGSSAELVTNSSDDALLPVIANDGTGGMYLTWSGYRSVATQAWAHHLNSAGTGLWAGGGVNLSNSSSYSNTPAVASDGEGSAIFTWETGSSIYIERLNGLGASLWGAGPMLVTSTANYIGGMVSDGVGGVILNWMDGRGGGYDIYTQRYSVGGSPLWTYGGAALCTQSAQQQLPYDITSYYPSIAPDGAGGAIEVWQDLRSDGGDIYAQKIERFGRLGDPSPAITRVSDVLADQGGQVAVQWTASYLDAAPALEVQDYSLWRRVPSAVAQAAVRAGAKLLGGAEPTPASAGRVFRALPMGAQTVYWAYVGTTPARGFPGYSAVAPTTTDSIAGSNPYTSFMVLAEDPGGSPFWASAADSGYSVDNLAPGMPAPFAGNYGAGVQYLHWGANTEPDLAGYRLYSGTSSTFVPGPSNLVVAKPDTGYAFVTPAGLYYKLSAVDIHGNESLFALLTPAQTAGVPGAPLAFALEEPAPNPARGASTLAFTLARPERVTLRLYDVSGRQALVLADGAMAAGRHEIRLPRVDAAGRALPGGLYFARLEADEGMRVRRVAIEP